MTIDGQMRDFVAGKLWDASGCRDLSAASSATPNLHLYAVVDASRNPMVIPATIEAMTERFQCLYQGAALEEFGDDTAWVAELSPSESLMNWLLDEGFGNRWAIFAVSEWKLSDFVSHLRKFTLIQDEEKTFHFFRFYDPKVLRQYLPVFTAEQRAAFFRGIEAFYLENTHRPDELLCFTLQDGQLSRSASVIQTAASRSSAAQTVEAWP